MLRRIELFVAMSGGALPRSAGLARVAMQILFITLFSAVSGLKTSEYIEPVDKSQSGKETYLFKKNNIEKEFLFSSMRVTWDEANIVCRSWSGHLAVVEELAEASFLSGVLAESDLDLQTAWIGAHRKNNNENNETFHWITNNEVIPKTERNIWYGSKYNDLLEDEFPYWINRTTEDVLEEPANCVGLDKGYHDVPIFIDLPCKLERSYICERSHIEKIIPKKDAEAVNCNGNSYYIYKTPVTWSQAASYCILEKMDLASFDNLDCMKKIGHKMMKTRPSIADAWIGGRGTDGKWEWVHSGWDIDEPINGEEVDSWPPFRKNTLRKREGCLLIDRHIWDKTIFLEANCEKKHKFICMDTGVNNHSGYSLRAQLSQDSQHYFLTVHEEMPWNEALKYCESQSGWLADVPNITLLKKLLLTMGESDFQPIDHIWVSGKLQNSEKDDLEWYDVHLQTAISKPDNFSNELPWYDEKPNLEHGCLNLDRESHIEGLLYGMPCSTPQKFICIIDKEADNPNSHDINNENFAENIPKINTTEKVDAQPKLNNISNEEKNNTNESTHLLDLGNKIKKII